MAKQTPEDISELKNQYVEYYKDVPVQRYAAMHIGRNEDTILRWVKLDADFAERVAKARAEWVRRKALKVRPDFALERLEKEIWSQRIEQKVDENTVDKILRGFGLLDDGSAKATANNPPKG